MLDATPIPIPTSPLPMRLATVDDIAVLDGLIARSARALSDGFYSPTERDAVIEEVFGVDSALVADGTYYVIEDGAGAIVACGGWGKRATSCGGDKHKSALPAPERLLDPASESANIRAFFVDPAMARRGLATRLMRQCEADARAASFRSLQLVATMPGVPLYRQLGFTVIEPYDLPLAVPVPVALMRRALDAAPAAEPVR